MKQKRFDRNHIIDTKGRDGATATTALWQEHISPLWKFWESTKLGAASLRVRPVNIKDAPVTAFVLLDAAEAQRLVARVESDLGQMRRVVNGTGLSTPDIQQIATKLIRSEVPDTWSHSWPMATGFDPIVFLQQLAKRVIAIRSNWLGKLNENPNFWASPQQCIKLSDFLRPDVFLNALRQQTARKLGVAIDHLALVSTWGPSSHNWRFFEQNMRNLITVQLEGLLLEGARFDVANAQLAECARQSNLLSALPQLMVSWASLEMRDEMLAMTGTIHFECVFKSSVLTSLL